MEIAISFFIKLLIVIQPLSLIPMIQNVVGNMDFSQVRRMAIQSSLFIVILIIAIFLFGPNIIMTLDVPLNTYKLIGGCVIIIAGIYLTVGNFRKYKGLTKKQLKSIRFNSINLSFVPLTIPFQIDLVAVILIVYYSWTKPDNMSIFHLFSGLFFLAFFNFISVMFSLKLYRLLSLEVLKLLPRLQGVLFIAIGIDMIMTVFNI